MSARWRVLIADDHAITRQGIRLLAESVDGVEVVGEAQTGAEAVRLREQLAPNIVFMDLNMPEMDGVEAIRRIKSEAPDTKVLVLSVDEEEGSIFSAIRAGASGYLSKGSRLEDLRVVFDGLGDEGVYMTPSIARKLVRTLSKRPEGFEVPAGELTPRERQALELLGEGLSARRIAGRLGIREGTVNTHIGNVYRKLGVKNRVDAVREAMRLHFIKPPE